MKKETIIAIDFDTESREVVEIFERTPDSEKVRTKKGWRPTSIPSVIRMRGIQGQGFMSDEQVQSAIFSERDMLCQKKYKHTGGYIVARKYPIKAWLQGGVKA